MTNEHIIGLFMSHLEKEVVAKNLPNFSAKKVSNGWRFDAGVRTWCEISIVGLKVPLVNIHIFVYSIAACWLKDNHLVFSVFDRRFDDYIKDLANSFTKATKYPTDVSGWSKGHIFGKDSYL